MVSLRRCLVVAALVCAAAVSVSGATDVAPGASCSNYDTCVAGYGCYGNRCLLPQWSSNKPVGLGNKCDATNCCGSGLACHDLARVCVSSDSLLNKVGGTVSCTGTVPTVPSTVAPATACDASSSTCGSGLSCVNNQCLSSDSTLSGVPSGLGSSCSDTTCCSGSLVCNSESQRCVVASLFSGLPTIACGGGGATVAPSSSALVQGSCSTSNTQCAQGYTCVGEQCLADAVAGSSTTAGTLASCSATQCCSSGLTCHAVAKVCLSPSSALNYAGGSIACSTQDPSTTTAPTVGTVTNGASCSSSSPCGSGYSCVAGVCLDSASTNALAGVGAACSETQCCQSDLGCSSVLKRCVPKSGSSSPLGSIGGFTSCSTPAATSAPSSDATSSPSTGNQPSSGATTATAAPEQTPQESTSAPSSVSGASSVAATPVLLSLLAVASALAALIA